MLRCAITDLGAYPLDSAGARWSHLQGQIRRWIVDGIDFIQLREKHLDAGALFELTAAAMALLRAYPGPRPQLLLNGRPDIAAAARADGVHLSARPGELRSGQVRAIFAAAALPAPRVSVSCHTLAEVEAARTADVHFMLFGPVFEKRVHGTVVATGTGLPALRAACAAAAPVPVLALGGITAAHAAVCLEAGAQGFAGIRMFA